MPESAATDVPTVPMHTVKPACMLTQILAPTDRVPLAGGRALAAREWVEAETRRMINKGTPAVLAVSPSGRVAIARLTRSQRRHVTEPIHA